MSHDIKIPLDLWEEDEEAVITAWLVNEGDSVDAGDIVAEIMVSKIQHEITAPETGKLSIIKEADAIVVKGDIIGMLN